MPVCPNDNCTVFLLLKQVDAAVFHIWFVIWHTALSFVWDIFLDSFFVWGSLLLILLFYFIWYGHHSSIRIVMYIYAQKQIVLYLM